MPYLLKLQVEKEGIVMANKNRIFRVGDVVKCSEFEFGYLADDGGTIEVGKGVKCHSDEESLKRKKLNRFRHDKSRASAEFVVIESTHDSSEGEGGSSDYTEFRAMRLEKGAYKPDNECIAFCIGDASLPNLIASKAVKVVRRMTRIFA